MTDGNGIADQAPDSGSRCGYVALVGRPNVGKSTLLNRILGIKLSIVTRKPQTTRQRICGIKTTPQGQVIYVDTPGIHRAARRALNRQMNRVAYAALREVDVVLFLVEAGRWTDEDEHVARTLQELDTPVYLVINKIDRVADKSDLLDFIENHAHRSRFEQVFLVSALKGSGLVELEEAVSQALPFSRPYFDSEQFTDRSERFLASELIREQLMQRLHQELPYSVAVEIESFKRVGDLLRIGAIVWVERAGQKQIVIGKGGAVLKQVGSAARREMESLFEQKVFLQLWVKVSDNWSDNPRSLRQLGLDEG